METKELTIHQRSVILRGIYDGVALKDESSQIPGNNTVITRIGGLETRDIYCISSDAETFGLRPSLGYDGHMRVTFIPKEQAE